MEQVYDIREMYFNEAMSIREISRITGRDRDTIKRYVELNGNRARGEPPSRTNRATRALGIEPLPRTKRATDALN